MNKGLRFVTLENGNRVPQVGFGTYASGSEKDWAAFTEAILTIGYRHIDTAAHYENEDKLGAALKKAFAAGLAREDLYISTKLWNTDHRDPVSALKKSLGLLGLDYVDSYLVHWPIAVIQEGEKITLDRVPMHVTWQGMEECVARGLARNIGVCNVNFQLLNDMLSYCKIKPSINQIELNPYCPQTEFVTWMKANGIQPIAYTPLGSPYLVDDKSFHLLTDPVVNQIAAKHGKSPSQVLLNWGMRRGHVVIPKSSNVERLRENFEAQLFDLDDEDMQSLGKLDKKMRIIGDVFKLDFLGGSPIFG